MNNRNQRIVEQLGMSHGAASGQLRKRLLFNSLVKLKENVCFVCGKSIEVVDDLSIEHKKPWENVSSDLFWNLDNIAYSHLRCNKQHSFNSNKDKRLVGQEGTSWCGRHKKFLPNEDFQKNSSRWSGVQRVCKECHNSRERNDYIPVSLKREALDKRNSDIVH